MEPVDFIVESPTGGKVVVPLTRPDASSHSSWYADWLVRIVRRLRTAAAEEHASSSSRRFRARQEADPHGETLCRSLYLVHGGRVLEAHSSHHDDDDDDGMDDALWRRLVAVPRLRLAGRLRGGMDRQNRVGSKFGGGGVSSAQNAERERKERLKRLALESIDLAKDPYLVRNHLGSYECKLCLTLHRDEANYLAHTQGKKHQAGLARRAHLDKLRQEREAESGVTTTTTSTAQQQQQPPTKKVRIGRPAYQVFKSREAETNQRCLSFELQYPDIEPGLQPRHRFMSAFEQKVEMPPDRRYQYLLFAAEPYETVAFKIPNEPIDKGENRFVTYWDEEEKKFILTLYFLEEEAEGGGTNNK